MKIYDCFTFFNELDLLEIRLNELNNIIDYFVIVESTKTHSGKNKPLFFRDNKSRFKKFNKKIIYIVVNNMPNSNDRWELEKYQRRQIKKGLTKCKDEDIILISDIDEIPNKKMISKKNISINNNKLNLLFKIILEKISLKFKKSNNIIYKLNLKIPYNVTGFKQNMYYFYINGYVTNNWIGTAMCTYNTFKKLNSDADQIRLIRKTKILNNSGWHYSYLANYKNIKYKIESFAHSEFDKNNIKKKIKRNIIQGRDLFGRKNINIKYIKNYKNYPKYIKNNLKKYKKFIK